MSNENAWKWVLGIGIYFVALALFMTMITNFSNDYGLDKNYTTSGGGTPSLTSAYCSDVRFANSNYDRIGTSADLSADKLVKNGYIYDETSCELYDDLTWNNATTYLWGLIEFSASCEGNINYTQYDSSGLNYTTGWFGSQLELNGQIVPLSHLTSLNTSQTACENFGFDWIKTSTTTDYNQATTKNFGSTFTDILTFRMDFSTQFVTLNWLLNLFLVLVPLIILSTNLYFMLPFT